MNQMRDDFGIRLGRLRKSRNLTQAQLAKLAGLAESHISHYECGRRMATAENLKKLARALKITIGDLI